ncbi:hypothetical protein [Halococcus sediminicola]|uniref:hypothetical protein n=1 Tax=Halococcus sediminicola TaxID=1264579 RepID=UPI000679CB55|nr:hypothetical protein [Halococcus sediminicola]
MFDDGETNLDDVISHALDQGYTVEIEKAEDHGYRVVVDGVAITRSERSSRDTGLPHEIFSERIRESVPDEVRDLITRLKRQFVAEYSEEIVESESSPWFVRELSRQGLLSYELRDWVDFDDPKAVKAALVKADLDDQMEAGFG